MGFDIWRSRKTENLRKRLAAEQHRGHEIRQEYDRLLGEHDWLKTVVESLRDELRRAERGLTGREKLLTDILIAVGRVKVFEDQPISSFGLLPELVSMVVTDHEDQEGRIDAVVAYLRHLGPMEGETETIRQDVGKLLQGVDPEIIDLRNKEG